MEEERRKYSVELTALEKTIKDLADEKLNLKKLLEAAGEASDEGAALGTQLEEVRGVLAEAEKDQDLAYGELSKLKVIVDALEESKVLLKGQIEEITKEKEDLQKTKMELLEKLNKLESECDHKWELESGLERASGEISEMRVELTRMHEECQEKTEELIVEKTKVEELATELSNVSGKEEMLMERLLEAESASTELAGKHEKSKEIHRISEALKQSKEKLEAEREAKVKEKAGTEEKIKIGKKMMEDLVNKLLSQKKVVAKIEEAQLYQVKELDETMAKLDSKVQELRRLKNDQAQQLETAKSFMAEEQSLVASRLAKTSKELGKVAEEKEDLRKQARVVTNPMRCTSVEEIRSLKEASKGLLQLVDRGQGHDDEKSKTWEEQLAAVGIKEHKVANQSSDLRTTWNNRSRRATRVVPPRPPSMSSA